jgi:hypothetical protein
MTFAVAFTLAFIAGHAGIRAAFAAMGPGTRIGVIVYAVWLTFCAFWIVHIDLMG